MNKLIAHLTIAVLLLLSGKIKAQNWEPVTGLPTVEFTAVHSSDNRIYAAAENKLFISSDGNQWQAERIHPISIAPTCITVFNGTLYVGTLDNGIYYRSLNTGTNWNHALLGLHISMFLVHDGYLHICSQGSGVWKNIGGTWNNLTSNLPTYSYTVNKIVSVGGQLLAMAGANGTFYRFNPVSFQWVEDYYGNSYQPGLMIDDAVVDHGVVLAADGHRLLRSKDEGNTWTTDHSGLVEGINRILFKGVNSIYALTLDPNTNYTYFQKRGIGVEGGTSWNGFTETLPFYTYAMTEFRGKLYMASAQGLMAKTDSSLGLDNPAERVTDIVLYPCPSTDGKITLRSDVTIDRIAVYDINGSLLLSRAIDATETTLEIAGKGMFLVRIDAGGQLITKKLFVH